MAVTNEAQSFAGNKAGNELAGAKNSGSKNLGSENLIREESVRGDFSVDTDAYQVENNLLQPDAPGWIMRLASAFALISMLCLPILFGGVHELTHLIFRSATFAVLGLCVMCGWPRFRASCADRVSSLILLSLLVFFAYGLLQTLARTFTHAPHPLTTSLSGLIAPDAAWSALLEIASFSAAFCVFRFILGPQPKTSSAHSRSDSGSALGVGMRFIHVMTACTSVVCLIALSHWFYDNGRLFWIYEPEHVGTSTRARWPFVNPNHLGHLLLIAGFISLGALGVVLRESLRVFESRRKRSGSAKESFFSTLSHSKTLQQMCLTWLWYVLVIFAVAITVIATLSRGTWLGLALGIFFVFTLSSRPALCRHENSSNSHSGWSKMGDNQFPDRDSGYQNDLGRGGRRRKRSKIRNAGESYGLGSRLYRAGLKYYRPIALLAGAAFLLLFLAGRGTELFISRVDYGLMHSKDDMRWQLYDDTVAMIHDHLIFGTGLGSWSALYPQYRSSELSGIDPIYLHSEPLQLLVELGVLGASLVGGLILLTLLELFRYVKRGAYEHSGIIAACLGGALALFIASFIDFPFRIPAINLYFAALCAITGFYCRGWRNNNS